MTTISLAAAFATFDQTVLRNPFIPHAPTVKQAEFLASETKELLYGGAAGGGKSDALLMAALQYVHVPDYRALLLRKTFKDLALPGALMDRAHAWLQGAGVRWNAQEKIYTFPSGASLTFGYLENENQKYRYQGAEFQFIGFDELTQFKETQYSYLASRLRRLADSDTPLRIRAATNPGGVGHAWVFRRFVNPDTATAPFVPAKLEDNPHLDREEYEKSLALLDAATRKQLLKGVWRVDAQGALWKRSWLDDNRVMRVPEGIELVRVVVALDPSATSTGDLAGIHVAGKGSDKKYYSLADWSIQASPLGWAKRAIQAYHTFKADRIVYEANQGGEMVRTTLQTVDRSRSVPLQKVWAKRGKMIRAQPISAIHERGDWHLVGEFPEMEDELCLWVPDDTPESPNRLDAHVYAGFALDRPSHGPLTAG